MAPSNVKQKPKKKCLDPCILGRLILCLLIMFSALAGIKEVISLQLSSFCTLLFLSVLNLWNGYEMLMNGNQKKARFLWLSGIISFVLSFGLLL